MPNPAPDWEDPPPGLAFLAQRALRKREVIYSWEKRAGDWYVVRFIDRGAQKTGQPAQGRSLEFRWQDGGWQKVNGGSWVEKSSRS